MRLLEKIACIIFLVGLLLKLIPYSGGIFVITLATMLLSVYYLLFGFLMFNGIIVKNMFSKEAHAGTSAIKIIIAVLAGFVVSPAVIAVPFTMVHWPGEHVVWHINVVLCGLLCLISLLVMLAAGTPIARRIFYRTLSVVLLLLLFHYIIVFPAYNHPQNY